MAFGSDMTVFVEDTAGDLGTTPSPAPWWLSPDVDIPAHPGEVRAGPNTVQVRVHAHEEPILTEKIAIEVYAGSLSLVLSRPTTRRLENGTFRFRPVGVSGSEPIADIVGGTLTFDWTPSTSPSDVAAPGQRCLVLRAYPESVTPPRAFDPANDQHEAQQNIGVVSTTGEDGGGGGGTIHDPRHRDGPTGMWWQEILTRAIKRRGARLVVWAFDPRPDKKLELIVRKVLGRRKFGGFSRQPPNEVTLDPGAAGNEIDPGGLLKRRRFARDAGLGEGLFAEERLLTGAAVELGPRSSTILKLGFDHSNLADRSAVVLHGAQWDESGRPEGGLTVVALAPTDRQGRR